MKILLIHNYYRYRGGEDRYVDILEKTLTQNNHQVTRFFSDSRCIRQYSRLKKWAIPFKMLYSPATDNKLEQLIKKNKPDLAVVHNLAPMMSQSLLKVLQRNGVPIVKRLENFKFLCLNGLFLQNSFKVCEDCKNGHYFHGVFRKCYQRSFLNSLGMAAAETLQRRSNTLDKTVNLYLATSEFVRKKFVEAGFPAAKITVLPNFIDFDPLENIVEPESYALYIGRLSKEKGLATLLKAVKELPEVPLRIAGEGPIEAELKKYVQHHKMKNVAFLGFIDGEKKKELLSRARFLIFPSECYESFGYTIVESLACGVPVIASGMGSAVELVREGENGLLFEPGNPADLQQKITLMKEIGNKKLLEMKKKSLQLAKTRYTKETGYKALMDLFKRFR
ncbi:MAG: glycosyltransferase family 4 protein [bacterium]|nr:glycosyltransferase family 4 protein [bacterium]